MLKSLYIKNFALIEEARIEFERGLTVITGETGAGKSILIGALSMVLGERAASDLIRSGSDRAVIEAVFDPGMNHDLQRLFELNDLEYQVPLNIRREITLKGQNRCFVNDMMISTAALKQIGDMLVDLHGQHEHQSLLKQELHIEYLDAYASFETDLTAIKTVYDGIMNLLKQQRELIKNRDSFAELHELYTGQLKEIQQVNPATNEDESLLQEEKILMSSEKLHSLSESVYTALYETDSCVTAALDKIHKQLDELRNTDTRINEVWESFNTAKIQIDELTRWIGNYNRKVIFDPDRLEQIRVRLSQIQKLKKKYGSMQAVIEKKTELEHKVRQSQDFEFELEQLTKALNNAKAKYLDMARHISDKRRTAGQDLDKRAVAKMKQLGMDHAVLKTNIDTVPDSESWCEFDHKKIKATAKGIDNVEFYLSANLGEAPRPLAKIASGGEISRIMLSLKSVLARADGISTLIFDEIDVGISGRIAQAVGKSLQELSRDHQLICITHLPQIAAMSDQHFSVIKIQSEGKTVTTIRRLNHEDKIREVAKLLGGEQISETALKNAEELIRQ